jgi:hypothetical protein
MSRRDPAAEVARRSWYARAMSPLAPAALALVSLVACSPASPPTPEAAPTPAAPDTQPDQQPDKQPGKVRAPDGKALIPLTQGPRPAPVPPLTQEELDLLALDPANLTPEMRRKRAFAVRRKILQNPDSPAARQLEALRLAAERGEINPQLPSGDLVLHTPSPGAPKPKP